MASEAAHLLANYLHHLSSAARLETLPDRVLIERFTGRRDEDAFAALVRRHGPMVLRVCQRVLHDVHAAEDAFQATFLVLSRQAALLRCDESVGCWLHSVAFRLAHNARRQRDRRQRRESLAAAEKRVDDPLTELSVREAQAILDEELARLPEKYRAPLVLCCLEGRTRDEAARQLGWSSKLVKSRLEEGRERLRSRLTRRGLTLPAALVATLLTEVAAPAAVPALLIRAAVQTMRSSNGVSPSVALLTESALGGTSIVKAKVVLAGLLLLTGVFAAGVGIFPLPQPPVEQAATPPAPKAPEARQSDKQLPVRTDHFDDPLPDGALARLGTTRFRHGGMIGSLAFTPDGKTLVSCGVWDGIRIWDVASGRQIRQLKEQTSGNRPLALSPDGKWLALLIRTASPKDEPIAILEFATGKVVRRMGKHDSGGGFGYPLFSPDGKILAVSGQRSIELWDPHSGRLLHTLKGHTEYVWSLAFSSDGKKIVSGSDDKTLRFWDVATGEQMRQIAHNKGVGIIAWSPDGKLLASIDETKEVSHGGMSATWHPENRVHLWDADSGKEVRQLVIPAKEIFPKVWGGFFSVGFTPDSKAIVSGAMDGTLRIWDAATGRERRRIEGFAGSAGYFAFAPDGRSVAVTDGHATIRIIDLATGTDRLPIRGHWSDVSSVVVTPDCQSVVTTSLDGTLRFWDAATGRERRRRTVPAYFFALPQLLPDGKTYLTVGADKIVRLHDLVSGEELAVLPGHDPGCPLALSPDRKTIASISEDKRIRLLDLATSKERHSLMKGVLKYPCGMSFSSDGRTLVICGANQTINKTITVWDAATGERLRMFTGPYEVGIPVAFGGPPYTAALSADGNLLAFGLQSSWQVIKQGGFVPVVDTFTGKEVLRFRAPQDNAQCLAFSPDGRTLAWSGWRDSTIHIGEIATGRVRCHFRGHRGRIESLAFSSDGKMLITGGNDTTAIVWDLSGRLALVDKWGKPMTDDELKKHWAALANEDAAASYRAMQMLAADPVRSIPHLRQRLHPTPAVEEKRLTRLIADLDSDRFEVRERATVTLEDIGEAALHALKKGLDGQPALETRRRLEHLIEKQERQRWSVSAERLRIGRALEVLERIGSPEARRVLQTLAEGAPAARRTCEAKAALARLAHRSAVKP